MVSAWACTAPSSAALGAQEIWLLLGCSPLDVGYVEPVGPQVRDREDPQFTACFSKSGAKGALAQL